MNYKVLCVLSLCAVQLHAMEMQPLQNWTGQEEWQPLQVVRTPFKLAEEALPEEASTRESIEACLVQQSVDGNHQRVKRKKTTPEDELAAKKKRLERNRVYAQQSRDRKASALKKLKAQVNQLTSKNKSLIAMVHVYQQRLLLANLPVAIDDSPISSALAISHALEPVSTQDSDAQEAVSTQDSDAQEAE